MKKQVRNIKMIAMLIVLVSAGKVFSQTNPSAQPLPYSQNFGTTTFTTMPSGMAAWTVVSSPIGSQTNAQNSVPLADASVIAATAVQTTGDIYGYAVSGVGKLYIQTSSNVTNGTNQPVLAINTTGFTGINVSFDAEMISANPRTIGLVLQFRVGTTGTWTNVSGGVYSHNNSDRTNGQVDSYSNLTLPSSADNQAVVQLRWAVWRGTQSGNSSGAAIVSITVGGTATAGLYYRSKQSGNWNQASTWEVSLNNTLWLPAILPPTYLDNTITIQNSHTVTITSSVTIDETVVNGTLIYGNNSGSTVTINDGAGIDLTINGTYQDIGPNSNIWSGSSKWVMGNNGTLLRTRSTSSNNWRDNYNGGTVNIPATATWIVRKTGTDNPAISSVNGMYYPNLIIDNTSGSTWTTSSSSTFSGSTDYPRIKGNLTIGGTGANYINFTNSNTNAAPVLVMGNLTVVSGSTLTTTGTGYELQGNVTMNGVNNTTGSAYILLSGNNTQTMSGGGLSFSYLKLNKTSVPATVTLNSTATITGTLTLSKGLIVSDTTHLLVFNAGSSTTGVNDSSFVSGPVKKIGNTDFIFPLGKNLNSQTLEISAPSTITDAFQAEYFDTDPTALYGTYSDSTFNYISTCQYFNLQRKSGSSNVQPTLSYDATSCVLNLLPNTRVVGYNGTKWKDLGLSNLTFSFSGGTVSTATVLNQYGPITLGNYNSFYSSNQSGDSCQNSIIMPSGATSNITGFTQTKRVTWFAYTPTTSEIKITLKNTAMGPTHIRALALMEGACALHTSAGLDSSATDTTLTITLHEAQVGVPYFIATINDLQTCPTCTYSPTTFNLQAQSLALPARTVSNGRVFLNGIASHMDKQIIIRVDKSHLIMSNVNNTSMTSGLASQFLDTTTIGTIAAAIFNGSKNVVNNLTLTKVFPDMTSADTLSLSRDSVVVRVPDFFETFILHLPTENNKVFYNSRTLNALLTYSEPNSLSVLHSVPNDALYASSQACLHPTIPFPNANINVEGAWDIETGQSFVKVGVYDCGIDGTHDDLNGVKVAGGHDYTTGTGISGGTNNDGSPAIVSHGTKVAGIIGGFRNDGIGIAGIAGGDASVGNTGCTLYDMRIFDASLNAVSVADEALAIHTGASSSGLGLHIMSCSWGGPVSSGIVNTTTLHDAVQYAVQNGVVFVASRGNYPQTTPLNEASFPACFQDEMVINVGASGTDGEWKTTTNGDPLNSGDMNYQSLTGHGVDVIAPGTTAVVTSCKNSGNSDYDPFDGTSAACPHVSGVAALMLSHVDQPTPSANNLVIEDVENILQRSAVDKTASPASTGYDNYSGWGLIDANATLNNIKNPDFKVQHFGVGQNVSSSNISQSLVAHALHVSLFSTYHGLAAGVYLVDKYLVTVTLNYNLSSPSDVIVSSWPRFSSTIGWDITDAFDKDNWCQIVSVSPTQAVLQTYVYQFYATEDGVLIDDPWFPVHYSAAKAAVSIYTHNGPVGISSINKDNSLLGLFPNPAKNNATINVMLNETQQVSLELYDLQGNIVKTIAKERASAGQHQYQISLADMAEGVYYVRLVSGTTSTGKKLVVVK